VSDVFVPFRLARRRGPAKPTESVDPRLFPARIARQLALAHRLQCRIDTGEFRNQSSLARKLGVSRERISTLLGLLLLAPDIQEAVLALRFAPASHQPTEAMLRELLVCNPQWDEQRSAWLSLLSSYQ
jgi:hypothetical protein